MKLLDFRLSIAGFLMLTASLSAHAANLPHSEADVCISGTEMESRPEGTSRDRDGYPGPDRSPIKPMESFVYDWDKEVVPLRGKPDGQLAMYLYVSELGEYVRSFDWSYCPAENAIHILRRPMLTRTWNNYIYETTIWVQYAPAQL